MTIITCEPILRSRHSQRPNLVLSTFLWTYPRWIHAEGRTHRLLEVSEDWGIEVKTPSPMEDVSLSRNASSSRAIPVDKLIQDVIDHPAIPRYWGANQRGMQAGGECNELVSLWPPFQEGMGYALRTREDAWLAARDKAIEAARAFAEAGYHKQIVNRLLEPFSHIRVVVSATEWTNFLALRDHPDAEPHIRDLAIATRAQLQRQDNIQILQPGGWHLPFVTEEHKEAAVRSEWDDQEETRRAVAGVPAWEWYGLDKLRKLSTARCASTSYKTVDGFEMTVDRAVALHDKLVGSIPMHASPMEHVAQADGEDELFGGWLNQDQHANFVGFRQYRKMLPGESS